ncbi:MAG: hypothetical protein ACYDAD_11725 [Acidimicrobiales bacterium]
MFAWDSVVGFAVLAGVLAAAASAATGWARTGYRWAVAGSATTAGFGAWYAVLNATHAAGFNTDAPIVGLSWADGGSGVFAFVVAALALGLWAEPDQPARRVIACAALAGAVAAGLDLFVL